MNITRNNFMLTSKELEPIIGRIIIRHLFEAITEKLVADIENEIANEIRLKYDVDMIIKANLYDDHQTFTCYAPIHNISVSITG